MDNKENQVRPNTPEDMEREIVTFWNRPVAVPRRSSPETGPTRQVAVPSRFALAALANLVDIGAAAPPLPVEELNRVYFGRQLDQLVLALEQQAQPGGSYFERRFSQLGLPQATGPVPPPMVVPAPARGDPSRVRRANHIARPRPGALLLARLRRPSR